MPPYLRYHAPARERVIFETFASSVEHELKCRRLVKLNFSEIKRLFPCGLLLLMGLVEEWVKKYPLQISANYPEDEVAEEMFQQVGLLEKLGLPPRKIIQAHDVTRWHYYTGINVDAEKTEPFKLEISKLISKEEQFGLFDCINEAMTNVQHHAYGSNSQSSEWWMFATVSDTKVYIAIHDRGLSIPGTLLSKPVLADIFTGRHFRRAADGDLIAAAMGGRSHTKLSWRGKGLPEMLDFATSSNNSELGIYSRNGFFRYTHDNTQTSGKLKWAVKGTLVLWMIDLSGNKIEKTN